MTLRDDMAADRAVHFDTAGGFAEPVDWNDGATTTTIAAIFQSPFVQAIENDIGIEAAQIEAAVDAESAAGIKHGDTLTRGAQVLTVISVQPDGLGFVDLVLTG